MRYACIEQHRDQFSLVLMCRALQVSRSGYHAWRRRERSEKKAAEQRLRVSIRSIHRQSKQRYGSPRVHAALQAEGVRVSRKTVERMMRADGLRAKGKRRFCITTTSDSAHPVAENLLNREFTAERPNEVWVGDITYIPTREGWLYLAVILDLFSRRVVGWAMQETLEATLSIHALAMALWRRKPPAGLLHHSDRGVQYTCHAYQELLQQHGLRCSMSRKGDCWDNAVAESFFATLEKELIEESNWHTRAEARRAIFEFIEIWYNQQRRHSSLGYRTPAEFEHQAVIRRAA